MQSHEAETVRSMLNQFVQAGLSYPQSEPLTVDAFRAYWLKGEAFVIRIGKGNLPENLTVNEIVSAFYLKPNFPGRCSHIANAGFIVTPKLQGQGLGRWMGETMLQLARDRGYRAVMYNLVFETNVVSLKLWESLGFQEIGRIPGGVCLPDGRYVDAVMLYRSLVNDS
jgi:GNAT superfamily N-acetyltransferase